MEIHLPVDKHRLAAHCLVGLFPGDERKMTAVAYDYPDMLDKKADTQCIRECVEHAVRTTYLATGSELLLQFF